MRICGVKHNDLEDKLFEWFCHAQANSIPVEGPMVKEKASEIALRCESNFSVQMAGFSNSSSDTTLHGKPLVEKVQV
jgi:hypothetical protein